MDSGQCDFNVVNLFAPFTNNGLTKFNSGEHRINADFINNGHIELGPDYLTLQAGSYTAQFINNGIMIQRHGYPSTFITHIPFFNTGKGSLEGIGTYRFDDTLLNEGSITPGFTYPGSEINFFYNPFQRTSIANIKIGKNERGKTKADEIFVPNNKITLDGTLNLYQTSDVIDTGYYTIVGTYGFINDTDIVGKFLKISKPDNWDILYTNIAVIVHVKASPALLPVTSNTSTNTISNSSKFEVASVFPNPANAVITIQFDVMKRGNYSVELFDMSGKQLLYKKGISISGTNKINIDVNKFLPGTYLVNINENGQNKMLKFFKK
jgi:hypothetical protein